MTTSANRRCRLAEVVLPEFGMPQTEPLLPASIYRDRMDRLRSAMEVRGYDCIVVWADREHSANMAYLTGFDPRFEEAALVVGGSSEPAILVGNECYGLAEAAPLPMRPVLFQDLSLPGQPRSASRALPEILKDEGIGQASRVGVVGWKTYSSRRSIEAPAFLIDELRRISGPTGLVENATDVLIDPIDGLRVINEVEQLAAFEWAACQTSSSVRRVLAGLQPGMTERDCAQLLLWNGSPLSCHLMLKAGPKARYGLLSPGDRPLERGDPFTIAFGIWGALNCRAGFVVEDPAELPEGAGDYLDRLVAPYFAAVADSFFGVTLNPGHQLHLDEWVNSPVFPGSSIELRSGTALQCDIIPATGTPYFTTNIEDGVALADESLRAELSTAYPDAWSRIQARRRFMIETLGVDLHPDVLPFSNLAAFLPPLLLRSDAAMIIAR